MVIALLPLGSTPVQAASANNTLTSAINLGSSLGGRNLSGDNRSATTQAGEPTYLSLTPGSVCDATYTLWYKWTAPQFPPTQIAFNTQGSLGFNTSESKFEDWIDTTIVVYNGPASSPTMASLVPVAKDDDANFWWGNMVAQARFAPFGLSTYYIQVNGCRKLNGIGFKDQGTIDLNWMSTTLTGGVGTARGPNGLYAATGGKLNVTLNTPSNIHCIELDFATAVQTVSTTKTVWTFSNYTVEWGGDGLTDLMVMAYNNIDCTNDTTDFAKRGFASALVPYNLDNTGPTVTGTLSPTPPASGWNAGPVSVAWSATDNGVGGATTPNPSSASVSAEGVTTLTSSSTDAVGNTGTGTAVVKIDTGAPIISGQAYPPKNAAGWNNTDVVVGFSCHDQGSGIGIGGCPAPVTLTGDGRDQSVTGTARDQTGREASVTVDNIDIDKGPPILLGEALSAPNAAGWYRDDVAVRWTECRDVLSGLAGPCPTTGLITGEGRGLSANDSVADIAGNVALGSVPGIDIDRTPPLTSPSSISGWSNHAVTVELTASDALSGVATTHYKVDGGETRTGTSVEIGDEGRHALTFWSEDRAGNVEAHRSTTVDIDLTGPDISHELSPPANANGWNNTAVIVTFACSDDLSHVLDCTAPQTLTAEGAQQSVEGVAHDNAGNRSEEDVLVSIDKTAPSLTGVLERGPDRDGWYTSPVGVDFTCLDGLSGIQSCPGFVLAPEGRDVSVEGQAKDAAGNTRTTTVEHLDVDTMGPTLTGTSQPAPNEAGWNNSNVEVSWDCEDAVSGLAVDECPDPTLIDSDGDALSATKTIHDLAGNETTTTVWDLRIDRQAPETAAAVPPVPETGWYTGGVLVTLAAFDSLSGVASTHYSIDDEDPQLYAAPFRYERGGVHRLTFWSSDRAGNAETPGPAQQLRLKIDDRNPQISSTRAPLQNSYGWNNSPVAIGWLCEDAESGIASCSQSQVLSLEGQGQSASGLAVDAAGNSAPGLVDDINIDLTAPTLAGAPTTLPNAADWYRDDVSIEWLAQDSLSGIDDSTSPEATLITGEGRSLSTGQVTVADRAGNEASASFDDVNIDRTDPGITGIPTTQPNGAGWYGHSVTISWSCSDPLSGIARCSDDEIIDRDGSGLGATGSAEDVAGNTASARVDGLNIDTAPPSSTAVLSCTGANDWCRGSSATLDLSADDQTALSGVAEIRYAIDGGPERVIAGAGGSIDVALGSASGSARVGYYSVDKAGNAESLRTVTIRHDNLGPVVTHVVTPAQNADGWTNVNTRVHFDARDDSGGSGVASVTPDTDVDGETLATVVGGRALDFAGNAGTDSVTIKLDKTRPEIAASADRQPDSAGWYQGPVTIHFVCSDTLSGIAVCPDDITVVDDGRDQVITGRASDRAGNERSASITVSLDSTPPEIVGLAAPRANSAGWNNSAVTVAFRCTDVGSGVAGCAGDTELTNEGAGQEVVGTAVDEAGNTASLTVSGIDIDLTAPTLTGTLDSAANAAGWHARHVGVHWDAQDGLSGIDRSTQPEDSVVTVEGRSVGAGPVHVSDLAGNTATASVGDLKIDMTAPSIVGSATAPPNANGWYRDAVTIHFACSDELSDIAACTADTTIQEDGRDQRVAGAATDVAGNTSTASVDGIDIDGTPPLTTADIGCENLNGYCSGDNATVRLTATDQSGSGVDELHYRVNGGAASVAQTDSTEVEVNLGSAGHAASIEYWSVDRAGNSEASNVATIAYDNVAPLVTHTIFPVPNAAGWNDADLVVTFSASDEAGGAGVTPDSLTPAQHVVAETPSRVVEGTALDLAGNRGHDAVTVKLDKTAPSIRATLEGAPNANGWFKNPVTVGFNCSDALSGIDSCPSNVIVTSNGAGQSVTGRSVDRAGNASSATSSLISIDSVPPTVTVAGPVAGGIYVLGAAPSATCRGSDLGSGLDGTCVGETSGSAGRVGSFTYTAIARDLAGNSTTVTIRYRVIYRWDGFLQPINDTAHQTGLATSVFKAGSTVPVKFQLKAADGSVLRAQAAPVWLTPAKGSATTAPVAEDLYGIPATSGVAFTWDAVALQHQYNWQTSKSQVNYYWRIGVSLDDGQTYWVNAGLR